MEKRAIRNILEIIIGVCLFMIIMNFSSLFFSANSFTWDFKMEGIEIMSNSSKKLILDEVKAAINLHIVSLVIVVVMFLSLFLEYKAIKKSDNETKAFATFVRFTAYILIIVFSIRAMIKMYDLIEFLPEYSKSFDSQAKNYYDYVYYDAFLSAEISVSIPLILLVVAMYVYKDVLGKEKIKLIKDEQKENNQEG